MNTHDCPDSNFWTLFAAGALAGSESARLRSHANTCETCRRELDSVTALFAKTRASFGDVAPDALSTLAGETWNASRAARPRPRFAIVPKAPLGAKALLGGAAAICAGIVLFAIVPGTPTNPSVTMAQIEESMREVKNVRWNIRVIEMSGAKPSESFREESFARLNPPSLVRRQIVVGSGYYSSHYEDENGSLSFNPKTRSYRLADGWIEQREFRPNGTSRQWIRDAVLSPTVSTTSRDGEADEIRTRKAGALSEEIRRTPWISTPDTLDGHAVIRLSGTVTRTAREPEPSVRKTGAPPVRKDPVYRMSVENTVWADRRTRRIVRRETTVFFFPHTRPAPAPAASEPDRERPVYKMVCDDYQYDTAIAPETFRRPEPKVGELYRVVDHRSSSAGKRRDALIPVPDAAWRTIRKAARAWNARDAKGFLAQWDFEAVADRDRVSSGREAALVAQFAEKRRADFAANVSRGIPVKRWASAGNVSAVDHGEWFGRRQPNQPFPPALSRKLITVRFDLKTGEETAEKGPISFPAWITLFGDERGYRILNVYIGRKPTPSEKWWGPSRDPNARTF